MSLFSGGAKAKATEPDKLGSIKIQSQGFGNVVPLLFGKTRITPTLFYYGGFLAFPVSEKQKTGKGGSKGKSSVTGYDYYASIMMGVCANHVYGSGKVWVDKKKYDSNAELQLLLYNGGTPWSYLTTYDPSKAVSLTGFAYVAAANYQLSSNATLGNHSIEIWGECTDGINPDANPALFIPYLLTNECGIPASRIANLDAFYTHCTTYGLLFSFALTTQQQASEVISHYLRLAGAELVVKNGKFHVIPYYGLTDLNTHYSLTLDDFIPDGGDTIIKPTRKKAVDAHNALKIEFLNRHNHYNIEIVEAKDAASIDVIGLRPAETITAHGIVTPQQAANMANYLLGVDMATRNTYEFTVSLRYMRLEPMDVIAITDHALGLHLSPVIIKKISITSEWLLKITAEDYLYSRGTADYPAAEIDSYSPDTTAPMGDINPPVLFAAPEILTATGYELWCAISSPDALYGGCEVHISVDDGASYTLIGTHSLETRMGVLTASLPSGTGLDSTNTLTADLTVSLGELSTVSQAAFDNGETLCRVNEEFLTYRDVNLTAPSTYDITHLQRGLYGSSAGAASGDDFVRCDNTLFKYTYDPIYKGKTIKLKFVAFNSYGNGLQDIADVPFYSFTLPSNTAITNASAATPTSQAALISTLPTTTAPASTDAISLVDASTGTLKQVSISDLSDPYAFIESSKTITGTTPLLVTEFVLPAGIYTEFKAVIGTNLNTTIATLTIRTSDGTSLKTLSRTGTPLEVTTTGFTLASDTLVGFYLTGDLSTTVAYVFSLGVK